MSALNIILYPPMALISALRACFDHSWEICAGRAAWHRITPTGPALGILCTLFLTAGVGYYLSQVDYASLPIGILKGAGSVIGWGIVLVAFLKDLRLVMAALMMSVSLDSLKVALWTSGAQVPIDLLLGSGRMADAMFALELAGIALAAVQFLTFRQSLANTIPPPSRRMAG